ncbi:hypothetical protein [Nocardioides maradonensis]
MTVVTITTPGKSPVFSRISALLGRFSGDARTVRGESDSAAQRRTEMPSGVSAMPKPPVEWDF